MPRSTSRRGWRRGFAEKFARAEAAAFVNGNGVDKPKGFQDYPKVANASWAWGSLGFIASGNASSVVSTDPLVDLVYALGAEYRAGATFVMNSKTTGVIRKLKDADGRYLWSDGFRGRGACASVGLSGADCRGHARHRGRGRIRLPLATLRADTPSPSDRTCACCAIRFRPSRMCCSTPPSAWAGRSATLRRSSCSVSR